MKRMLNAFVLGLALPMSLLQAATLRGTITDAESGEALINAQVELLGQRVGAATNLDGSYLMTSAPAGSYSLRASFLGYQSETISVNLDDDSDQTFNFQLDGAIISQAEITVVASVAKERETPVAFSNVKKADIQRNLGARDVPMALETTPGVYATMQGGGSGDARINIRGFNQRNVAVMINGVPVNDMENGWVYWSNWDGLGDVTSSMQVQRGLSAVNLAVPSVGGTMNILTDAADLKPGLRFKTEMGNDGFAKKTLAAHTGLVDGRFALSAALVRKEGDGLVEGTWTDAWAWFIGSTYIINDDHRLDFYGVGAPQRHGQNLYKRSIASYSTDFAREEGIDVSGTNELGIEYNQTWGYIGQQTQDSWDGDKHDPYHANRLYERENYYHKPQFNLNWYWDLNEDMRLATIAYHSYGVGGGTGRWGSSSLMTTDGHVDWDATVARNQANTATWTTADGDVDGANATTLIRNSVNIHYWWGLISKLSWDVNEDLNVMFGLDWRTFVGKHYREIRNLLGADFYVYNNGVDGAQALTIGDKIGYNFDNTVDWMGGFAQAEYTFTDKLIGFGMLGLSTVTYEHQNYWRDGAPTLKVDDLDPAYTLKAGLNYLASDEINYYGNFGYMSKNPIFDNVIDDGAFIAYENPDNETIMAMEAGMGYSSADRKLAANVNVYYTSWMDRSWSLHYTSDAGNDYSYNVPGVDATHMGVEIDALFRPVSSFQLKTAISLGNWEWGSDASSSFRPDDNPAEVQNVTLALDGLKVSDAPQTTITLSPTWFPRPGAMIGFDIKHAGNYYAAFDPENRSYDPDTEDPDRAQAWKVPSYTLFDFHTSYTINLQGVDFEFFGHVYNMFDTEYISDAQDGSSHDAAGASVFFGLPRTWNLGVAINL